MKSFTTDNDEDFVTDEDILQAPPEDVYGINDVVLDNVQPKQDELDFTDANLERQPSNELQTLMSEFNALREPKNELKNIQKNIRDKNTKLNYLLGANQIAQGITAGSGGRMTDGADTIKMLQDQNQNQITDYKDRVKDRMDDPNSDISKFMRYQVMDAVKKQDPAFDVSAFDQMSANELEKFLTKLKSGAASNKLRVFDKNIVDEQGKIKSRIYDETGKMIADLGEAGYSYGTNVNPYTGQIQVVSKSNPYATPILQGNPNAKPIEPTKPGEAPKKISAYDIKQQLNPKQKELLDKDVNQFQNEIKEDKRIISEIGNISDFMIEESKKNANAAATLGAQIAKIMQGSRLTDSDVKLYTGREGILNRLQDFASEKITGTINDQKAKEIKQTLDVYNEALRKALAGRAVQAAEITKQNFGPDLNIDSNTLSKLYYIDDRKALNKPSGEVRRKTSDGKIAIFDEKTKKFLRYEE